MVWAMKGASALQGGLAGNCYDKADKGETQIKVSLERASARAVRQKC